MAINQSIRALPAAEMIGTMAGIGTPVQIGILQYNPVIIIFDNQSTTSVMISFDGGVTTWKTFTGGEALVLDLRAAHGIAGNMTFAVGTEFTGTGAANGDFSISYIYAKEGG